jgi:hypothetical protein
VLATGGEVALCLLFRTGLDDRRKAFDVKDGEVPEWKELYQQILEPKKAGNGSSLRA